MPPIAAKRRHEILALTNERGIVSARELGAALGVSDITIRRDIQALAQRGVLQRTRGGAVSLLAASAGGTYDQREQVELQAKARIGEAAARLVADGDSLFLGSGTTVLALARHLHGRQRLTVITDSIPVVLELLRDDGITVVATGGTASDASESFVGTLAEHMLGGLRATRAFIGTTSVSPEGFSNASIDEAAIHRRMIAYAQQTYILADHTKLKGVSLAMMATLDEITGLVTDEAPPEDARGWLDAAGLRVIVAAR